MCLMSQNSFSTHKSFDSVLLTYITLSAIVEKWAFSSLAEISLVREELAAVFLFVSSFMAFHVDSKFWFNVVSVKEKTLLFWMHEGRMPLCSFAFYTHRVVYLLRDGYAEPLRFKSVPYSYCFKWSLFVIDTDECFMQSQSCWAGRAVKVQQFTKIREGRASGCVVIHASSFV